MKYEQLLDSERSALLSSLIPHREHFENWMAQLEAQDFFANDPLLIAVEDVSQAMGRLVQLLSERQPMLLEHSTPRA